MTHASELFSNSGILESGIWSVERREPRDFEPGIPIAGPWIGPVVTGGQGSPDACVLELLVLGDGDDGTRQAVAQDAQQGPLREVVPTFEHLRDDEPSREYMLDDQPPASLWSGLMLLLPLPSSCRPRVRGGVLAANERSGQAWVLPEEPQGLSDDAGLARQSNPRSHRGNAVEDPEDRVGVPRVTGQPSRSPWLGNPSARGTHPRTIPVTKDDVRVERAGAHTTPKYRRANTTVSQGRK